MANFQVIFSGNEDELYRFVITWKMMADTKKYEERAKQLESLENSIRNAREELRSLEMRKRELEREVAELTSLREALKRELASMKGEGILKPRSGEAAP